MYSKIRPALRKAAIATEQCLCSADMYPLSPVPAELLTEYLLLILLYGPATKYLIDSSMRVAMPKVNRQALGNCWLSYPGLNEQREIVTKLNDDLIPVQTAISRAEREIYLIREYRNRLISDVVTGKTDVRQLSTLFDEDSKGVFEELPPLDEELGDLDEEAMD